MASAPRFGNARSLYRALLRVRKKTFAGDESMIQAAAVTMRNELESNRHVTDPTVLSELLEKGREAVDYIALNVVQAKLNERGNYEMKVENNHSGESLEEVVVKVS